MFFRYLIIHILWLTSFVHSTHFRGGYISWQVVSSNVTNTSSVTILITQTYSWANSVIPCGQLIGDADYLICITSSCSNYANNVSIRGPCTSYDLGLDVSTAKSTTSLKLLAGSQLALAFQSSNWLTLVYGVMYPAWSLLTYIDLSVRTDNGHINSSPTSNMAPLVNVLVNTYQTLRIPVADIDLDVIKCRWSTNATLIGSTLVDECGGVCQNMPNAQLYTTSNSDNNCTLTFNTTIVGYYAVAVQIEDFMPSNSNGSALSSIPLQFLVRAINITCPAPNIIGELVNGATVQLQSITTFTVSVIAQIGCNGTSITRFSTIAMPSGIASTSTITTLNASLYSIIFIWIPDANQIGTTQLYCTMAIDSNNLQSAQYCLNLVLTLPTTTTSTSTTTVTSAASTTPASTLTTAITTTTLSTAAGTATVTAITVASTTTGCTSGFINSQSNDLSLILGLGLGLGLLSLLLLSLLCCFCCCRYCNHPFWSRFRQDTNVYCSVCNGKNSGDIKTTNKVTPQYREQYINNNNPFELGHMTATTTTLMSQWSNSMTTINRVSSRSTQLASRPKTIISNGSILVQAYAKQESAKYNSFN